MGTYHWYKPTDGSADHDNSLSAAREKGLYPSVTTVQKAWAIPSALQKWSDEQLLKNSLLAPYGADPNVKVTHHHFGSVIAERNTESNIPKIWGAGKNQQEALEVYNNNMNRWIEENMFEIKAWAKVVLDMKWATLGNTADFGTDVHNELEHYNLDQNYKFKPQYKAYCDHWIPVSGVLRQKLLRM